MIIAAFASTGLLKKFDAYSDLITFLSIIIGFQITSLSILYNSPLTKKLYDTKIPNYKTELHRIKDYYKHSLIFESLSVLAIFLTPNEMMPIEICTHILEIGKYSIVLPILLGTFYCFYKVSNDLLMIFVHPTNH